MRSRGFDMDVIKAIMINGVKENPDHDLIGFYFDPYKDTAIGGYRRQYDVGDLLIRVRGEMDTPSNVRNQDAMYHFLSDTYTLNADGLPAKRMADGGRAYLSIDEANGIFDREYERAKTNGFTWLINPKEMISFLEEKSRRRGMEDAKVNIEIFSGINSRGHFPAKIVETEGGKMVEVKTKGPDGKSYTMHADINWRTSTVGSNEPKHGDWYIARAAGKADGRRFVNLLRPYLFGARIAIHRLENGLLMPGDPRYSVIPAEDDNSILVQEVKDFAFMPEQEHYGYRFEGAPMITVDMDSLYRSLKCMTGFHFVEVNFNEAYESLLLIGIQEDGVPLPNVEIIVGLTSPYRSGKVCI